jgi:hypothetical protein
MAFSRPIVSGMDVCDVSGEKVGSIAHLHRVGTLPDPSTASAHEEMASAHEEILEVKTGLLGLGKHLYVPVSAVQEVLTESVFLSRPKEEFESLGYYEKPVYLSKLD